MRCALFRRTDARIAGKPVVVKAGENFALLSIKPAQKAEAGRRNIVVKGEARGTIEQYSRSIPLSFQAMANGGKPRAPDKTTEFEAGVEFKYYEGAWEKLPDFDSLQAVKTGTSGTFAIDQRGRDDGFGFKFSGFIDIKKDGVYTFYSKSDDGSRLLIGKDVLLNNDGLHAPEEESGQINLKAGKHAITVLFFEGSVGEELVVSYEGPGVNKQAIPAGVLFHEKTK